MSENIKSEIEIVKENYDNHLTQLWVELNEVANLVNLLKQENHSLKERLLKTEEELTINQNNNVLLNSEIEKLKSQISGFTEKIETSVLIGNEEKENLKKQVEFFLDKLNSHL